MFSLVVILAACGGQAEPEATAEPTDEPEPTATETATPEPSATPTDEPTATDTPEPTSTPTDTPDPTETPTATTFVSSGSSNTAVPTDEATQAPASSTPETAFNNVPPGQSVWQLDNDPSEWYSSDACPGSVYYDFYGLVAIEKISETVISWQVPNGTIYTLQQTEILNSFWGRGGSPVEGYYLTISAYFSSPQGMGVTYALISNDIEGCNHVFKYGAARAW